MRITRMSIASLVVAVLAGRCPSTTRARRICRATTGRWPGWRVLAAMARLPALGHPSVVLFACLFASQSGMLVLSPILVDVAREFGVSTATAGHCD